MDQGHRDRQIHAVHQAVTRDERRHEEVDVHRHLHANDVVLEERLSQGIDGRRVLVREVELDVIHADAAQALEVHRADIGPDEEPSLAERLRPLAEDRPSRCRRLDRQSADELVGHAARGGPDRCVRDARRQ